MFLKGVVMVLVVLRGIGEGDGAGGGRGRKESEGWLVGTGDGLWCYCYRGGTTTKESPRRSHPQTLALQASAVLGGGAPLHGVRQARRRRQELCMMSSESEMS